MEGRERESKNSQTHTHEAQPTQGARACMQFTVLALVVGGVQVPRKTCFLPEKSIINQMGLSFFILDSRRALHSALSFAGSKTHLKSRFLASFGAVLLCVLYWPSCCQQLGSACAGRKACRNLPSWFYRRRQSGADEEVPVLAPQ